LRPAVIFVSGSFLAFDTFFKLLSCQLGSSCYYLVLRQPDPVGERATNCVSVLAVRYRAFVFAAPRDFVAGNPSTECRGAVSVGVVSPRAATLAKNSLRPFEGVPLIDCSIPSTQIQGKQTRDERIILSDEAKGVSL